MVQQCSLDQRAKSRVKIFQPAQMRSELGIDRVHLLNLSATGAMAHHQAEPPVLGSTVHIACAGLWRDARIVWVDGSRFGICFLSPLTDDQLRCTIDVQNRLVAEASRRVGPLLR